MRDDDEAARSSRNQKPLEHHSSRGRTPRNSGNFTRGSQLLTHELTMWWQGVKLPLIAVVICWSILLSILANFVLQQNEIGLILMRIWSGLWVMMDFNPGKIINLTLPTGMVVAMPMASVPYNSAVQVAVDQGVRIFLASVIGAVFIIVPLTIWFVEISRKRGSEILIERHERGARLVDQAELASEIMRHNSRKLTEACALAKPPLNPAKVAAASIEARAKRGIHNPYSMAGLQYPWGLEQSHTMLIGTTGAGKTTQLKRTITEARRRGHTCVIFDLTGTFVESFYNPETDIILNPFDKRCPPWTIFNECRTYPQFMAAAVALVPGSDNGSDPFWQLAARTLFIEMCLKLMASGETSNGAIAHHLMTGALKDIHRTLKDTVAGPLTTDAAAKMAESIRAVFNAHAQILRFLPDPGPKQLPPFSITDWMKKDAAPGSILFITSKHEQLDSNRALLTLWLNTAVHALMGMSRTRDLRTWFLFDELHALHRMPAVEQGLQTARNFGGAFVLGMHSFDALCETYGQQGAVNLTSLARTKLILTTSDINTAKVCTDFIGSREVRQMDEAYSYGASSTRDAATITPRKAIEPLVIPDDITNLRSMTGFVKFPEGFPAALVELKYVDYPRVAPPYIDTESAAFPIYVPPAPTLGPLPPEEGDAGGREPTTPTAAPSDGENPARVIRGDPAEGLRAADEDQTIRSPEPQRSELSWWKAPEPQKGADPADAKRTNGDNKAGIGSNARGGPSGPPSSVAGSDAFSRQRRADGERDAPEQQIQREERDGIGGQENEQDRGPDISDDLGMGD